MSGMYPVKMVNTLIVYVLSYCVCTNSSMCVSCVSRTAIYWGQQVILQVTNEALAKGEEPSVLSEKELKRNGFKMSEVR